jgi:phosphoenolpyruvate-protein phosphotransferase
MSGTLPTPDKLLLLAPVTGPLLPLEQVPDPVFAEKMVGDGVSIDPVTSRLLAPCDAEVLTVHPSGHAITLRAASNVELILHIGLDTVALRGEGFLPLKKKGDRVRAGEPLIDFAADYVATRAPSLLTQMVISNPESVTALTPRTGYAIAGRDVVLEATLASGAAVTAAPQAGAETLASRELAVLDPTGLHARPAAVIAATARKYTSDVRVRRGKDEANARSVTAIMALEISGGETIVITASGPDAREALSEIVPLVEAGLDETAAPARTARPPAADESLDSPICLDPARCITGVSASPGLAIGTIVGLASDDVRVFAPAGSPVEERRKLDAALARARTQLREMSGPAAASTVEAGIFRAHLELLDDPDLVESSGRLIAAGAAAGAAWQQAFAQLAAKMAGARSEIFAQRAADVRDVGRRVLRLIAGTDGATQVFPDDAIVVAHELTPSDAAGFDKAKVRGFCTVTGGSTSHVAILARSLGIPAVVAIDRRALELPGGTRAILDGTHGAMMSDPTDADIEAAQAVIDRVAARRRAMAAEAHAPAVTRDGVTVEVAANVGAIGDADAAALGADGVGLLRSEFLFLDRSSAPDEDEQYAAYSKVVSAFGPGKKIIIRTLDVGGDKPLSYLPLPREDNPFLGIRGIRVSLQREDMLRTQLRAILRAARHGNVHVMFPMVATIDEWRRARRMLTVEGDALGVSPIPAGIMVEVPAVAMMAEVFAAEVDFFSIGTNDLTQYTLAMDRGQPALAAQIDALHPSVLRLIAQTTAAAAANGRWTGVCGALASEEAAVPVLLGLGVTELSASGPVVPAIKARVRSLVLSECKALAQAAMRASSAAEVRALLRS